MAYFGEGQGPIHMDNVRCTGTERSLADCVTQELGRHNCRHSEDAGVICDSFGKKASGNSSAGESALRPAHAEAAGPAPRPERTPCPGTHLARPPKPVASAACPGRALSHFCASLLGCRRKGSSAPTTFRTASSWREPSSPFLPPGASPRVRSAGWLRMTPFPVLAPRARSGSEPEGGRGCF